MTYYISTTGSDSAGRNGSNVAGQQWATLNYAFTRMVSGDIIHVNAGTYTLAASQINVPAGMSIEGDGMGTTTMVSTVAGLMMSLASGSYVNGNQHVSGIYFNGNNRTTGQAVQVTARSNVSFYNCTFINFAQWGIIYEGGIGGARSTSVTYATGNSVHDCVFTNCAYYEHGIGGGANVMVTCQTGFDFYNNNVTQSRTAYTNGCGFKTAGWTKGTLIHGNTLTGQLLSDKDVTDSWDFAVEMWGAEGSVTQGTHIYNNTILNWEIDISGRITQKGLYDYGCSIHDNFIGCTNLAPVKKHGIQLEANTSLDDILIYNNHIKNIYRGIYIYVTNQAPLPTHFTNISIYYNLFEQMGVDINGDDQARAILISYSSAPGFTLSNLKIYNNVMHASTRSGSTQEVGIQLMNLSGMTTNGIDIKNNIIVGFDFACISNDVSGTMSNLTIQNNIFYNNGHSNTPYLFTTPSPYTNSGNLTSNPLFVSATDFHLQAGSPAINSGLAVTLPTASVDYDNITLSSPPERGVYEYGSSPSVPTITTTAVTNITTTTASSGGNVTADGGATVTARGVCWATTSNPTTANSHTTNTSGLGVFTSNITGLTQSTIYHVRAYATNSAGTAYGNDIQFITLTPVVPPTVTTTSATNITYYTALTGGNVTSEGGAPATRGICWAYHSTPTLADVVWSSTNTGTGAFSVTVSGLTENTTVYVRAWATNSAGTSYGNQISFTTLPYTLATVSTAAITAITQNTATSGGGVINNGGTAITEKGVCWSTTASPTTANSHTSDGIGESGWVSSIIGLTGNTLYYVRAYATNTVGTAYGNQLSFTSGPLIPTLFTTAVTSITQTTSLSGGNTLNGNGSTITAKGVCWNTSPTPTIANSHTTDGSGTANYASTISGLTANTTYYVRSYATNAVGTGYGDERTWGTLAQPTPGLTVLKAKVHKWFCQIYHDSGYGALYNWYAATYNTGGASIVPVGWHIPTFAEYQTLVTTVKGGGGWRDTHKSLRETGGAHWQDSLGTNISGFTGLGAGYRTCVDGSFLNMKVRTFWHSCENYVNPSNAGLALYADSVYNDTNEPYWTIATSNDKKFGMGIRPIKDDSTDPGTVVDIDGNVYPTVKIGDQVWFASNLKTTHYNNGVLIPEVTNSATWIATTTGAMCYYNNDPLYA